jgi:1-aminocyclopropane-1-carboxylate deaminase
MKDYFPENSKILAFHTGGVQGIAGANEMLRKKNRATIDIFREIAQKEF